MELSLVANIFSIVSGAMTILGLGGVIGWSLWNRGGRFSETVVQIATLSLKLSLSITIAFFLALTLGLVYPFSIRCSHRGR